VGLLPRSCRGALNGHFPDWVACSFYFLTAHGYQTSPRSSPLIILVFYIDDASRSASTAWRVAALFLSSFLLCSFSDGPLKTLDLFASFLFGFWSPFPSERGFRLSSCARTFDQAFRCSPRLGVATTYLFVFAPSFFTVLPM